MNAYVPFVTYGVPVGECMHLFGVFFFFFAYSLHYFLILIIDTEYIYIRAAARNRYTWSVWGQKQVHYKIKSKTYPRSPAIGSKRMYLFLDG